MERTAGRGVPTALALSITIFLLLIPATLAPILSVDMLGAERTSALGSGLVFMWEKGWVIIAVLLGAFGLVLPLLRFAGLSFVLGAVLANHRPSWLGRLFRWVMWLDIWAMPDVFLIGFFIGYTRVSQHLNAQIQPAGYCFIAAAFLTVVIRGTLDRRVVWRAVAPERALPFSPGAVSCPVCDLVAPCEVEGGPCPRCGLVLRARKPDAVVRAAALTAAALVLYIPANYFPMTVAYQLGSPVPHRIVDGIRELVQAGLWPFAILIFCTSIAIPLLKLCGMAWFVYSVKRRSRSRLRLKTRLYRMIDELGRWSNVDVFTLVIFIPLIRFGELASAWTRPGATAFTLVVFFTMMASRSFDPRLMWDAAEVGPMHE